jgi:bacteriocin-like protein
MNAERELTINELDAVSGGAKAPCDVLCIPIFGRGEGGGGGGGGGAGPAIDAWNTLLHSYGF